MNSLEEVNKGTCFGLAYCCHPNKPCIKRDLALNKIGISNECFIRLKEGLYDKLKKLCNKKNSEE